VLLEPPAGREYDNSSGVVPILSWQSVGTLSPNEYYHVTFHAKRQNGTDEKWIGLDTADTQLTVTEQDASFLRMTPQMSEVSWWVTVLSQPGSAWQTGGQGTPVSPNSEARVFWMKP
jgi:hypothetical protein